MANFFEGIPVRSNEAISTVDDSWWNVIRTYLMSFFVNYFGEQIIGETQFTILDNQDEYQTLTGLVFDKDEVSSFDLEYTIQRTDGTETRRERGALYAHAVSGVWSYSRETKHGEDALGAEILNSLHVDEDLGEVQYKSDEMGGTHVGTIRVKVMMIFQKEAA